MEIRKSNEYDVLNKVLQKYLSRLMKGALDIVEDHYGSDSKEYENVRRKILRLGNDQKRDVKEFLDTYIPTIKSTTIMPYKPLNGRKG